MKIYGGQGLISQQADKIEKKNVVEKNDFQSIMDQITSSSIDKGINVASEIKTPIIGGSGIVIDSSFETLSKEEVAGTLKDTLDLVDCYADKLADSSLDADSLSPLVGQLQERLDLLKGMESDTGTNDKLKTIISDVVHTMAVEIERFKRGDYH